MDGYKGRNSLGLNERASTGLVQKERKESFPFAVPVQHEMRKVDVEEEVAD